MSASPQPEKPSPPLPGDGPLSQQLPPVEPPAATFLIQLFLIPLVIVSIIVAVWLLFSWVGQMGSQPKRLVQDLEQVNHASWQQALRLAQMLQDSQNSGIRRDTILAKRLADILQSHLEQGRMDDEAIQMRGYLALALGEFETADSLSVLTEAATREQKITELEVRRKAIWAIGRVAEQMGTAAVADDPAAIKALDDAASDIPENPDEVKPRGRLRSTVALAYGMIGCDHCKDQLASMLHDPYADTRLNATVELARLGDERAQDQLLAMLDPENELLVETEEHEQAVEWKRVDVILKALDAAIVMLKKNPEWQTGELRDAVQKLQQAELGKAVETKAQDLLRRIDDAGRS